MESVIRSLWFALWRGAPTLGLKPRQWRIHAAHYSAGYVCMHAFAAQTGCCHLATCLTFEDQREVLHQYSCYQPCAAAYSGIAAIQDAPGS